MLEYTVGKQWRQRQNAAATLGPEAPNLKSREGTTQLHHFPFSLHSSSTSQKGFSSYRFGHNTKTFDGFPLFSQSSQTLQSQTRRYRTFKVFHEPGVWHKPVIPELWRKSRVSQIQH